MFTKFFIRAYPIQQFLVILVILMVYVISFSVKGTDLTIDASFSILHLLNLDLHQMRLVLFIAGFIALLLIAHFMSKIITSEKIIPSNSYLLLLVFLVLSLPYLKASELNSEFFAFLFIAPAYSILLSFSQSLPPYRRYTDLGILT